MPGTHCARCAAYESAVMALREGASLPAAVAPCEAYAMSDAFREHLVGRMRKEVLGQLSAAGLDRMAIAKGKAAPPPSAPPPAREPAHGG